MRHASIQTTMNVYGRAMMDSKRPANGKVVEMVIRSDNVTSIPSPEAELGAKSDVASYGS